MEIEALQTGREIPPSFSAPPQIVISKPLPCRTVKEDELPDILS
jgi:hypothetical protein